MSEVTQILERVESGDAKAADELLPLMVQGPNARYQNRGNLFCPLTVRRFLLTFCRCAGNENADPSGG